MVMMANQEKELANAKLTAFRMQLHPHFLFNSLNTLSGLIYKDVDKADEFTIRLSSIYRFILDHQREELIPLKKELLLIEDFMYLNNIRFQSLLHYTVSLKTDKQYVVPMALQLIFENVIKHNTISAKYPMVIELFEDEGYLVVQNKIQLKQSTDPSQAVGLTNLKQRYANFSDLPVEVIKSQVLFKVRIPILLKAEL